MTPNFVSMHLSYYCLSRQAGRRQKDLDQELCFQKVTSLMNTPTPGPVFPSAWVNQDTLICADLLCAVHYHYKGHWLVSERGTFHEPVNSSCWFSRRCWYWGSATFHFNQCNLLHLGLQNPIQYESMQSLLGMLEKHSKKLIVFFFFFKQEG